MFFWFKKKKIVLDCFTHNTFAYEYCNIAPATQYYPEWYNDLSPTAVVPRRNNVEEEAPTLRHCIAFSSLFKSSFIIPSWTSFKINFNKNNYSYKWYSVSDIEQINEHTSGQVNGFLMGGKNLKSKLKHLKIVSPWLFSSNKYIKYTWHDITWNKEDLQGLTILPGVLGFKYNLSTEINYIVDFEIVKEEIIIDAGTPLVMLTPLYDGDIEVKNHLISEKEFYNKKNLQLYFTSQELNKRQLYEKKKKFITNYEKRLELNEKKCPFGYGKK